MREYIRSLREKSHDTRQRILFLMTGVSMVAVVGVWIAVMPYEFGTKTANPTTEVATTTAKDKKAIPPFSVLRDNLKNAYNAVSATASRAYESNTEVSPSIDDTQQVELEVVE